MQVVSKRSAYHFQVEVSYVCYCKKKKGRGGEIRTQFNLTKIVPLVSKAKNTYLRKSRGNFHGTKQPPPFLNLFACVHLPNLPQSQLSCI